MDALCTVTVCSSNIDIAERDTELSRASSVDKEKPNGRPNSTSGYLVRVEINRSKGSGDRP